MENQAAPIKKTKFDLKSYGVVVAFLCLEIMAFLAFNLGHSIIFYGILSIALAVVTLLVTWKQIKSDGLATFAFFLFPLFIYGFLNVFTSFNLYSLGAPGLTNTIFVPIAILCFSLSGYLSCHLDGFKIKNLLLIIYGALGLFVLVNLITTMVYYVPFYTITYNNSYIFYNGSPSTVPIGSTAYMLFGFSITEVSITYWTLYPTILFTAVVPLFFISPIKRTKEFVIYAVLTLIAFISLLFTVNKFSLLSDGVLLVTVALLVIIGKKANWRKFFKYFFVVIGALFLLGLTIFFFNSQTSWSFTSGLRNLIANNYWLNRLFNTNRFSSAYRIALDECLSKWKLFGCYVGDYGYMYPNNVRQMPTNSWLFDNIYSVGIFGALFFAVALVIGVRRMLMYFKDCEENVEYKLSIFAFIFVFFLVGMFAFPVTPQINNTTMTPIYMNALFLIVVFLMSYCFNKSYQAREGKKILEKENKKEEVIENEKDLSI